MPLCAPTQQGCSTHTHVEWDTHMHHKWQELLLHILHIHGVQGTAGSAVFCAVFFLESQMLPHTRAGSSRVSSAHGVWVSGEFVAAH